MIRHQYCKSVLRGFVCVCQPYLRSLQSVLCAAGRPFGKKRIQVLVFNISAGDTAWLPLYKRTTPWPASMRSSLSLSVALSTVAAHQHFSRVCSASNWKSYTISVMFDTRSSGIFGPSISERCFSIALYTTLKCCATLIINQGAPLMMLELKPCASGPRVRWTNHWTLACLQC